jgi:predicted metal-binding membrane protein
MYVRACEVNRFAAFAAQASDGPLPRLLALSAAAYTALAVLPQAGGVALLCGRTTIVDLWYLAQLTPRLWSLWGLVADWALMVVAMMTPLTALQVAHVRRSSLSSHRVASVTAFLAGYWATWFAAFPVLLILALSLASLVGEDADLPAALLIALAFSASPAAQWARNRCHRTGRIPAFGVRSLFGCARQGLANGTSCVAACWPWMLVPMAVQSSHLAAMFLVGAYLFADRISPAARVGWRLPPAWETLFGPHWGGDTRLVTADAVSRVVRWRAIPFRRRHP